MSGMASVASERQNRAVKSDAFVSVETEKFVCSTVSPDYQVASADNQICRKICLQPKPGFNLSFAPLDCSLSSLSDLPYL